jgi:hypothetical protein
MAAGRLSIMALYTLRISSYDGSPGVVTAPRSSGRSSSSGSSRRVLTGRLIVVLMESAS